MRKPHAAHAAGTPHLLFEILLGTTHFPTRRHNKLSPKNDTFVRAKQHSTRTLYPYKVIVVCDHSQRGTQSTKQIITLSDPIAEASPKGHPASDLLIPEYAFAKGELHSY